MTFISFAQNFEDVMLWRALKHVVNGFYIDVGAADPDSDSVTRAFYDRGWHGINIEPEPGYAAALRDRRPRDVNLELAVGQTSHQVKMFQFPGTGLSTFDPSIAKRHEAAGFPAAVARKVEMSTLAEICTKYRPAEIHFLKIDAEGSERDVLLGADFRLFRPWIIVVEGTEPASPVRTTERFEDILQAFEYRFRWFDGLNAFFIASEHDASLLSCFASPPNVHDHFVDHKLLVEAGRADRAEAASASQLQEAREQVAGLEKRLHDFASKNEELEQLIREGREQAAGLEKHVRDLGRLNRAVTASNQELESSNLELEASKLELEASKLELKRQAMILHERLCAMLASTSWRITYPLRRARSLLGR